MKRGGLLVVMWAAALLWAACGEVRNGGSVRESAQQLLRSALMGRLRVASECRATRATVVYEDDLDGEAAVCVWRVGPWLLNRDGEVMLSKPARIMETGWDGNALDGPPAWLQEFWREVLLYVSVSEEVRRGYEVLLCDDGKHVDEDVLAKICLVEHNRMLRDMCLPWWSWTYCERHAQLLKGAADVLRLERVVEGLDRILRTCQWIRAVDEADAVGNADIVALVCRAEMGATDGRVVRSGFKPALGFYSGGWAFSYLPRKRWVDLAKYWDSDLVTRYAVAQGGDVWKLVSLGERVRGIGAGIRKWEMMGESGGLKVGESCTLQEFVEWADQQR